MSFYSVSAIGAWPNERYLYQIDSTIIDPRYTFMPIKVLTSPLYSEDHNFSVKSYNPPNFNNSLIGLSSNKPYIYTDQDGELNASIEPDLSFFWTPSTLRLKNYGNMFNGILLNTSDNRHYTVISYPSELFLYPNYCNVINNYQTLSTDIQNILIYTPTQLDEFITSITSITAEIASLELETPLVSSFSFVLCSLSTFSTNISAEWEEATQSGEVNTYLDFTSSIETEDWITPLSTFSFVMLETGLCSFYIDQQNFDNDYNYILTLDDALSTYKSSELFINSITAFDYSTYYQVLTSKNYELQTNTVLLNPFNFQLYSIEYGRLIKLGHNAYLSTTPELLPLSSTNLKNLSYSLSGALVNCNKSLIKFTETNNPIYENILLEKPDVIIRPETVKLSYFIEFIDFLSGLADKKDTIGDEYDDMVPDADRSIETSYIVSHNETENNLTFQLLQSATDTSLPMEHPFNSVLSAVLDLDNSSFEYLNQRFVNFDALYAAYTPISGTPNTDLVLRYIANTPYKDNNLNYIDSTVLGLLTSNYGEFSVNSAISIQEENHQVTWLLEYPPYYYNFKNNYTDNYNQSYKNKTTLSFYLSSELTNNTIVRPLSNDPSLDYIKIDLYTSIYSDFDILELPLKNYANLNDQIKYELVFRDSTLIMENVSAFLVFADNKEEAIESTNFVPYDIQTSPYVNAVSGVYLRILYDLKDGATLFSIKPSLKTELGIFDAFWGTTFRSGENYQPRNFLTEPTIQTLETGITSVLVSIADLTGNPVWGGINLTDTIIQWDYSNSTYPLTLVNKTCAAFGDELAIINPLSSYLFNFANTIEIVGISEEDINVTFYSQEFEISSTVTIEPTLFDLYYENRLLLEFEPIDIKNKIKAFKANVKVPFSDKVFYLNDSAYVKWEWIYNESENVEDAPVSAYYIGEDVSVIPENINDILTYGSPYEVDTILLAELVSSIYFIVDTDFTTSERFIPLSAYVEVNDLGETFEAVSSYNIYSYPDPSIFSSDFYITYPNFPLVRLADTQSNLSLTRPPNGTNIYEIIASELKTQNVSISTLKWNIDTTVIPTSSIQTPYKISDEIVLTQNVSGFYNDTILNRNFNLYVTDIKTYYNNEFLTGLSSKPIYTYSNLLELSSYLISETLTDQRTVLSAISTVENVSPLASTLNIITTSYYITSFISLDDLRYVTELNNFYSFAYTVSTGFTITEDDNEPTNYTIYSVDYWLSSQNITISDDQSEIESFSSVYIWEKDNIIFFDSFTTPTTTVEYVLSREILERFAYVINDIYLIAEDVSIPNWNNLYNFSKKLQVITTNNIEFLNPPKISVLPKHIWLPTWKADKKDIETRTFTPKKTNKYVTHLSDFNFNSFYNIITGITYGNRLSCQEFHLIIADVQDFPINYGTDPITIIVGVGNSAIDIMDTQIIDTTEEYTVFNDNNIKILNFRIPCYPDIYENTGMTVYVTAFNRFFPAEGGFNYFNLPSLTSTELEVLSYPITAQTFPKNDPSIDELYHSPRLIDYDKPKLSFYPKLININLDTERLIQVKQILEIEPIESPVEIILEDSGVIYELVSDFWTVSSVVPAVSNQTFDIFKLSVGDSSIPLTVSDFDETTLFLTATAVVATKIQPTTFNRYTSSEYTEPRDIWGTVYQMAVGNEEITGQPYKILFSRVNSLSTETETISSYDTLSINDNIILTT